ncbi:MAG: hypothetical protein P1U56_15545 [Saprospiraceae bacterium]|nr:hypothetical protein [Saprospiraceae bacterium]
MLLSNTTSLATADALQTASVINLIQQNTYIVFVVLGDDEAASNLVQIADNLSLGHSGQVDRKVVWLKDRTILKNESLAYLNTLEGYDDSKYDETIGYVLSPVRHEAKYVFCVGDSMTNYDVTKAYWKASLKESDAV